MGIRFARIANISEMSDFDPLRDIRRTAFTGERMP
jgi:hypothetical protein